MNFLAFILTTIFYWQNTQLNTTLGVDLSLISLIFTKPQLYDRCVLDLSFRDVTAKDSSYETPEQLYYFKADIL